MSSKQGKIIFKSLKAGLKSFDELTPEQKNNYFAWIKERKQAKQATERSRVFYDGTTKTSQKPTNKPNNRKITDFI